MSDLSFLNTDHARCELARAIANGSRHLDDVVNEVIATVKALSKTQQQEQTS